MCDQGPTSDLKNAGSAVRRRAGGVGVRRTPRAVPAAQAAAYLPAGVRLYLLAIAALLPIPAAQAAESPGSAADPLSLGNWLLNLSCVLGMVYMGIKIILAFRRQPPIERELADLSDRFAPKAHEHSQYICRADCETREDLQTKERLTIRQAIAGMSESTQDAINHLRLEITSRLDQFSREAEQRSSNLHKRIDPIATGLAGTAGKLDNHLEDHRAGKGRG